MTLTDMVTVANNYTDENFKATLALSFVNEAIGTINADLKCNLPFIDNVDTDYTALSETWARQVLIPYISYSIKMNDGSLNEANYFLQSYERGMLRMEADKFNAIPVAYQLSDFDNTYQIDYTKGIYEGFGLYAKPAIIAEYDEYTYYYAGDYVTYNNLTYKCLKQSYGNLPTDTNYWREVE